MFKRLVLLWAVGALLLKCSDAPNTYVGTDNASETTNGISGIIKFENGEFAEGASVTLYPSQYNHFKSTGLAENLRTSSKEDGTFFLSHIDSGSYNLEVISKEGDNIFLLQNIAIGEGGAQKYLEAKLSGMASIKFPLEDFQMKINGRVYIPGTSTYVVLDSEKIENNMFTLQQVAPGIYSDIRYFEEENAEEKNILTSQIKVEPSSVFTVPAYATWGYSQKILIKTGSNGVSIDENVYNFPMLVRLDNTSLVFSGTDSLGESLRFSNALGQSLSFELEDWNWEEKKAEFWVLVDTIFSQNDSQFIQLHWGKEELTPKAISPSVFKSENGYLGVWHFSSSPIAQEFAIRDAGEYNILAEASESMVRENQVEGRIGFGLSFNDTTDYFEVNGLAPYIEVGAPLTFSVWFKAPDQGRTFLISGGSSRNDNELFRVGISDNGQLELQVHRDWEVDGQRVDDDQWHWAHVTFEETGRYVVYLDGVENPNYVETGIPNYDRLENIIVGAEWDSTVISDQFGGILDEMRLEKVSRSSAWVKLCFETQKQNLAIFDFREPQENTLNLRP